MAWKHTKSAEERGYGPEWRKLRNQVMREAKGICQCRHCKASGVLLPAHEVDHIIRKEDGGTDARSNLQAINRECHKRKTIEERGHTVRRQIGVDGWPKE